MGQKSSKSVPTICMRGCVFVCVRVCVCVCVCVCMIIPEILGSRRVMLGIRGWYAAYTPPLTKLRVGFARNWPFLTGKLRESYGVSYLHSTAVRADLITRRLRAELALCYGKVTGKLRERHFFFYDSWSDGVNKSSCVFHLPTSTHIYPINHPVFAIVVFKK